MVDREDFEEEVRYRLKEIKIWMCTKGKLDTTLLTIPLSDLVITWHQNKQGKGRNKSEQRLLLNNLEGFQQKGCLICTVEGAVNTWPRVGLLWQHFHKTGLCHRPWHYGGKHSLLNLQFVKPPNADVRFNLKSKPDLQVSRDVRSK